jgi:hypothetical protein
LRHDWVVLRSTQRTARASAIRHALRSWVGGNQIGVPVSAA